MLEICDVFFTVAFTLELLCKIVGLGPKAYVHDFFNNFDALIVAISIVDAVLYFGLELADGGVMSMFRALRLLRMFKLARVW